MSKINCSIDLNAINKDKIKVHSNGSRYYNFDVQLMKEPDRYGQTHTIIEQQTKEERTSGAPKNYLGKGKEFVFGGNQATQPNNTTTASAEVEEDDDLPF